jgi:multimeric flavodoxin WrbA
MKVIAIVGSPRKNGNTEMFCAHCLQAISEEGLETELISLAGKDIRGCTACMVCTREETCSIHDDLWPIYEKMKGSDGIILASPVYFGSCTALLKGLIERTGNISRLSPGGFRGKVGGPLVVARRAGHNFTIAEIDLWYHIMGMIVPGSTYWNLGFGRERGDIANDEEGLRSAWNFGKNVALVIKKVKA